MFVSELNATGGNTRGVSRAVGGLDASTRPELCWQLWGSLWLRVLTLSSGSLRTLLPGAACSSATRWLGAGAGLGWYPGSSAPSCTAAPGVAQRAQGSLQQEPGLAGGLRAPSQPRALCSGALGRDCRLLSCSRRLESSLRGLGLELPFQEQNLWNQEVFQCRGLWGCGGEQASAASKPVRAKTTQVASPPPSFVEAQSWEQHQAALGVTIALLKLLPGTEALGAQVRTGVPNPVVEAGVAAVQSSPGVVGLIFHQGQKLELISNSLLIEGSSPTAAPHRMSCPARASRGAGSFAMGDAEEHLVPSARRHPLRQLNPVNAPSGGRKNTAC